MRVTKSRVIVALITGVVLAILAVALRNGRRPDRYLTATVDRGDVAEVVGATGALQAVVTVQVGSQVSGSIETLEADFNSRVKKGQVIVRLDPSLFEARLGQARANLVAARANAEKARTSLVDARLKYERAKELAGRNLVPPSDLETAQANYEGAAAQLKGADAAVTQAEASVHQAEVDLDHTVIRAPIDGVVVARNVDVGQTVAASFQAPVLFILANDLSSMQVVASVDEADIGRVRPGAEVTFRVDSYPERTFVGHVEQVRLQPTVVQNVVTYNAIISVDNPGQLLMPGMTATVYVIARQVQGVLRIPATALRFRPEGYAPGAPGGARTGGSPGSVVAAERPRAGGPNGEGRGGPEGARGGERGDSSSRSRSGGPRDGGGGRPVTIFVLTPDGKPEPRPVRIGLSDGQFVEVKEGLDEGAPIITGLDLGGPRVSTPPSGTPTTNPFSPQFQRRQR